MKKAIQLSALMLTMSFLLVGCGKGGGSPENPEPVPPVIELNGVDGSAVKGAIEGAAVTVVDGNGDALDVFGVETGADGSYTITFSEASVATGIIAPIQVIIDGTGATSVCDAVNPDGSGDDCLNADGTTYASFGNTFTLPTGFEMRAVLSSLPTPTEGIARARVNPNPFTEMATVIALAGGTTLTAADVDAANLEVLGNIQLLFPGIDVGAELAAGGFTLNSIPVVDVTDLANANTGSLQSLSYAIPALSASMISLVDPANPAFSNVSNVIATLAAAAAGGVTNGDMVTIGTAAANAFANIIADLGAVPDVVLPSETFLADIGDISTSATIAALTYAALDPTGTVEVPDPTCTVDCPDPPVCTTLDEACALAGTKVFVADLAATLNAFVELTGLTDNGAVAASSPLGLGDAQYRWIQNTYFADSTATFQNLLDGINAAALQIKLGEGTGDNSDTVTVTGETLSYTVVGTESATGSTFTVTDASSASSTVTLTVTSGTRTVVEAEGVETSGTFSATGVTLVTADSSGTLQTFTGSLSATFAGEETGFGLTSLTLAGNVNVAAVTDGTAGGNWGVEITLSNVSGSAAGEEEFNTAIAGNYSATFNVAVTGEDELIITLAGTRGEGTGTLDDFSISVGDNSFNGAVSRVEAENGDITDTTTLTNQNETVTLTLTVLLPGGGATSATGVLTSLGFETGTLSASGTVTYSDDTIQNLNAAIFRTASQ